MAARGTILILALFLPSMIQAEVTGGMLYPRESESREIRTLDGLWDFRADDSPGRTAGFDQQWYTKPLRQTGPVIDMPVPSSFNDVTQDRSIRDFVGWVWYDKEFFPPRSWEQGAQRIVLRFESAHYNTIVWFDSKEVVNHSGGHLPFEAEVTSLIHYGRTNRITVAVNNTLTPTTLPPGTITYFNDPKLYPPGYFEQAYQMDFFNYAGIQRPVKLYTTPSVYVDDITITTNVTGTTGIVNYKVTTGGGSPSKVTAVVELLDKNDATVASSTQLTGSLHVTNANLWWPYTMRNDSSYLYTLKVAVFLGDDTDVYRLPVGIRTVRVTNKQFFINEQQFYFHGVNKHEDADIRGKGLDFPLITKDLNLLKWLSANAFRTSHYPYAEEIMDLCDRHGIIVIDESPAVGLTEKDNFGNVTLEHHHQVMAELIRRDKNRPSVVMWSVANEPKSTLTQAGPYFKSVISYTRSLDLTRPVTFVSTDHAPGEDQAAQYVDVLCLNSYYSWYNHYGHLEIVGLHVSNLLSSWHTYYNRPVIQTEYGAGTISGFHSSPSVLFTEEYQDEMMADYQATFDKLRQDFLIGELVWNFADFNTQQTPRRCEGNKKGILTRQRQPKSTAHRLRDRYLNLVKLLKC